MYKKYQYSILVLIMILLSYNVFAISTFEAQDIAGDYTIDNEFLNENIEFITCNDNSYYVATIVNSNNEAVFFVPINYDTGNVTIDDIENNDLKELYKTVFILKSISNSKNSNYLSQQLVDKIDRTNTVLKSKNAQLEGIIKANYSYDISNTTNQTSNYLSDLIDLSTELYANLNEILKKQQVFLNQSNCNLVNSFIIELDGGFEGYNQLTSLAINYKDSTNAITEAVVADQNIDETTKKMILNYITPPTSLSSDIDSISESISFTYSFYNPIIEDVTKTGENSKLDLMINNLVVRKDLVEANKLLYELDADFDNSLDNVINHIIDSDVTLYWKDTKTLEELKENYNLIKTLYNRREYSKLSSKILKAKNQANNIIDEGFIEQQDNNFNMTTFIYVLVGAILVIVIAFVVIKNRPHKGNKKRNKAVSFDNQEIDFNNNKDPFK